MKKYLDYKKIFNSYEFTRRYVPDFIPIIDGKLIWDSANKGTYIKAKHGEIGIRKHLKNL